MTSRERSSPEIETVIDRHLSLQTQLTTVGSLEGPASELDARTHQPQPPPGVILWDKVLYNRTSTSTISSVNSHHVKTTQFSTQLPIMHSSQSEIRNCRETQSCGQCLPHLLARRCQNFVTSLNIIIFLQTSLKVKKLVV